MIRLQNVLKTSFQDFLKMSWRRLREAFRKSWRGFCKTYWGSLKTSWRCLGKIPWRCLEDVLKTSSKRLEIVLKMSWRRLCKTFWRHLWNVLKTTWRRMAKTKYWPWSRRFENLFKRSSEDVWLRRVFVLIKMSWRHLLKNKTKDIFKTCSRRLYHD